MTAALRYRRSDLLLDYGRAALGAGLSGAVLAVPLLPFLLPLSMFPIALVFGLVIVGAGKLLAALGLVKVSFP